MSSSLHILISEIVGL